MYTSSWFAMGCSYGFEDVLLYRMIVFTASLNVGMGLSTVRWGRFQPEPGVRAREIVLCIELY